MMIELRNLHKTFSIQFNKIRTISKTFVLSFLTWFLFPVSFVFMVVYHKVDRYNLYESCSIKYDAPTFFDESFIMQIIIYSPYLIGAIISFVIFRRDLKRIT